METAEVAAGPSSNPDAVAVDSPEGYWRQLTAWDMGLGDEGEARILDFGVEKLIQGDQMYMGLLPTKASDVNHSQVSIRQLHARLVIWQQHSACCLASLCDVFVLCSIRQRAIQGCSIWCLRGLIVWFRHTMVQQHYVWVM